MEIANGFFGIERSRRAGAGAFLAQNSRRGGDEVPKQLDVDYVRALAHGDAADRRAKASASGPADDASDGFAFHPRCDFVSPSCVPKGNSEEEPPAQAAGKA